MDIGLFGWCLELPRDRVFPDSDHYFILRLCRSVPSYTMPTAFPHIPDPADYSWQRCMDDLPVYGFRMVPGPPRFGRPVWYDDAHDGFGSDDDDDEWVPLPPGVLAPVELWRIEQAERAANAAHHRARAAAGPVPPGHYSTPQSSVATARHDESYTAAMLESPPPDTLGTRLVWRAMCASTYVETCQLRLAQATAPDSHSQWAIPTDEALEQEEYDRWEDYGEQQALSSHMEAYGRLQDDDDDDLGFGRFIP